MDSSKQLSLFQDTIPRTDEALTSYSGREIGTFKDSLRAPIYRWFRYPAGYSYKFVFESFDLFDMHPEDWVYDPFSGSGTTLICAKQAGINGYGVEAHSFVHWVASVKLHWDFDFPAFAQVVELTLNDIDQFINQQRLCTDTTDVFPKLVYKCYHPDDLTVLYLIREFLNVLEDEHLRDFFKLALTDTLRGAAAAGTGWPYISPRKNTGDQPPKDAVKVFKHTVRQMVQDLRSVMDLHSQAIIHNVLGDSRVRQDLEDGQVKLALTSPPYLNNYDYADRTRLETYFWGITHSWSDITKQFRDKLMVAATTQVTRHLYDVENTLDRSLFDAAPHVYETVQRAVLQLADLRLQKGGRKDYDLMTALYFNDIFNMLQETYRVLQPGGHFCLVLGDSAPYGVHIETDLLIGELAQGIGFTGYDYHLLRTRGGKWKDNPQRHNVKLREGIVIITR